MRSAPPVYGALAKQMLQTSHELPFGYPTREYVAGQSGSIKS
jgi:hypothetical protein